MPILETGQTFERYRIIRWLGNGVSGESYEAEDSLLLRKLTLKLIHPWMALQDAARRQFFREMQGISMLTHPYLAAVLDYGEVDGRLYIARRYVSSGSLLGNEGRSWFSLPLRVSEALHYAHQLAQALHTIHTHDYLHGALTLSNILVLRGTNIEQDPDYAPFLVADVGLTNFVRRFGQPQMTLLPITTAPEQLGKRVTTASDQFALAVILYLWLTGRPPYLGSPEEVEHLKLTETIPPLSLLNPQVTINQEAIVRRALSVYPDERYPSILAFADALLASLTTPSLPTPSPLPESALLVEFAAASEIEATAETEFDFPQTHQEPETVPALRTQDEPESALILEIEAETEAELAFPERAQFEPAAETESVVVQHEQAALELETKAELVSRSEPEVSLPQPAPDIYQPIPVPEPIPQTASPAEEKRPSSEEIEEASQTEDLQPIAVARLIIISPYTEEPIEVFLERDGVTLGRAGASDILLDQDNLTSRHQAFLKHEDNSYILYDRQSANGTFVNGQQLIADQGYVLEDGDHISIGNYELIFRSGLSQTNNEGAKAIPTTDAFLNDHLHTESAGNEAEEQEGSISGG